MALHDENPIVAAISVAGIDTIGDRRVVPASKNQDRGQTFGELGYARTEFRWFYRIADGVDLDAVLDAAAAELVERGATLERGVGLSRELRASTLGDELSIRLVVDATLREMDHRTMVDLSG